MKRLHGNKYFRTFLLLISLSLCVGLTTFISNAQTAPVTCDVEEEGTGFLQMVFGESSDGTVGHLANGAMRVTFLNSMGASMTDGMGCEESIRSQWGLPERPEGSCGGSPDTVCQAYLGNQVAGKNDPLAFSLLGMGYKMERQTRVPPPVNLAYFWNDSISRLPLANKALAVEYGAVQIFGTDTILAFWKGMRNISLAILSVVLLVVGIMIILRKKVNQQTVVSIQYALPRLVLSFVLIILSYPIGATLTNLGWALNNNAGDILGALVPDPTYSSATGATAFGAILLLVATAGLAIGAAVASSGVVAIVIVVALVLLFVYYWLKLFLVYLKMIFSIVSAPLEFAISAIPGSQDKVMAWFKRMGIYTLTLFLMGGVPRLAMRLSLALVGSGVQNSSFGWGAVIGFAAPVIILAYGYGLAIGMESRVQKMIDPDSAKKR